MQQSRNTQSKPQTVKSRRGAIVPLLAISIVPLMGMLAFGIDYGYMRVVKTDLQRAVDCAALAAVVDLVPNPDGSQNLDTVRATVRDYVQENLAGASARLNTTFTVLDADIEIGRYDETTIYSSNPVTLLNTGMFDAIRVTLRRDNTANGKVPLFFARVLGINDQEILATATAVLRRGVGFKGGADILPFSLPESFWDSLADGSELSIYNDNTIQDSSGNEVTVLDADGNSVPGNWGTVDIGYANNSSSDLKYQIVNGIIQSDIQVLYDENRLLNNQELKAPVNLQAEPGLSIGIKDSVISIYGQTRIIPIYDAVNGELSSNQGGGGGNNAEFHTIKWGVVKVLSSSWNGNNNTYITSQKAYTYDGAIIPKDDLSDKSTTIENAFCSPVLVR